MEQLEEAVHVWTRTVSVRRCHHPDKLRYARSMEENPATSPDGFLDALLTLPKLASTAVSPDGRWAAWTWYGIGPTANVYAAPIDRSAPPLRLTHSSDDTVLVSWTPDSRAVLVARDHDGDERAQLFRVDLDRPGALQPLTEPSPPYYLRGGNLHPNGRWLIYAMNFDVASGEEIESTWVYRHDLETGERLPLARPRKPSYYEPSLNDAGTHVLYNRQDLDPAGYQVWLVDIDGREDREILNVGPKAKIFASWFPDSKRVLFLAETGSYRRLGVWDLGSEQTRWLIDDPARNIEWAHVPRGCDSRLAVVLEIQEARTLASLLDLATAEETRLPGIPGNLAPRRPLEDGEWVGRYSSATQPTDLISFRPADLRPGSFAGLTGLWERTSVRPSDLTPAQDFGWRSADGLQIQGWLYRPSGPVRGTIVVIHGGPTGHSEDDFDAEIQYFVEMGFNVLDPNYRGSTGFGLAFEKAIKEDGWGGREQDDIRTGIEALIAAGIATPGKVGVTGTSYGGYSSWCAITRWSSQVVAAAAPICGMTDLVVDYETTRPDLRPYSEEMLGGSPEEAPERYYERSPIHFVHNIRGRMLIVQGLRDANVTPENMLAVRDALDRAGVYYELQTFDDEGHGIRHPKNQRVLYRRLVDFFADTFQ